MFLVMSAAYVAVELQAEFGTIPPSFLPLGNRRLFYHQNKIIPSGVKKYISLPESYVLNEMDKEWLQLNGFNLLYTPEGLTIGASLIAALSLIDDKFEQPLHILFGDTLISELPCGDDVIALSTVKDRYNWAYVNHNSDDLGFLSSDNILNDESGTVVCGYFKVSQPRQLVRCITQSHWDFIDGINRYHRNIGLKEITVDGWLDFGHVNTYYRSKAKFTTQRAFNELKITPAWVEKSSVNSIKIKAEAAWFDNIPFALRGYTPQLVGVIDDGARFSYRLEYLHHTALNELFVFSELPAVAYNTIFDSCIDFLKACRENNLSSDVVSIKNLFHKKTELRLEEYCRQWQFSIEDKWEFDGELISLADIMSLSVECLPEDLSCTGIMHGDFCFSNILYDFRSDKIKTIDPRGIDMDGNISLKGSVYYDIAKLAHSVIGLYDFIIAGYYKINISNNKIEFNLHESQRTKEIQHIFIKKIESCFRISEKSLLAMQIQLFLSMLPLHHDDELRQKALFSNAFRLFLKLKRSDV